MSPRHSAFLLTVALVALQAWGCAAGEAQAPDAEPREPVQPSSPTEVEEPAPRERSSSPSGDGRAGRAAARRGMRLVRVGTFDRPLQVTAPPGDPRRVFVVEQGGRIRVLRGGRKLARPFLDLSGAVSDGGERGLLGLAFAPDYARRGRFYVHYTDTAGDTRLVEYRRRTADRAAAGSARVVLRQDQPEANHNGGQIAFGPDGLLYMALGDGGGAGDRHGTRGNAQDPESLLGKILRIDPRPAAGRAYRIPRSNPYAGNRRGRGEVYAIGLRNPWRFSFDSRTGDLAIGDVGQDAIEEIDFVARGRGRGANFGWRPWEGNRRHTPGETAPGHVRPVITRSHEAGWCSITGGVVVRDPDLPALAGRYVFGDFCRGVVYSARLSPGRARQVRPTRLRVAALSSFGEDARGRVYATSLEGPVYRLRSR